MRLFTDVISLHLEHPFVISYGATTVRQNVLVRLEHGSFTGFGEAAVVPYYGETVERVLAYLHDPALLAALGDQPLHLEETLAHLPAGESSMARAAVDIALHDLWGQMLGQPLYRLWGLNPARCARSSFTVGMVDDEPAFRARLREAQAFGVIKLKLGGGDPDADLRRVQMAREETPGDLCVDANGGWSADQAARLVPELAALKVMFIEQPVARHDLDGWRRLRAAILPGAPPLIADESVQDVASIFTLAGLADGINIKLAKCGGLRAARQMIAVARGLGMQVMIGCMVESSVAVTAAAHLSPLVDYADLDGPLLINNDPFRGVINAGGQLTLPDAPGLGVKPRAE